MANVIQHAMNFQDKSARSVFVGNIPFEATEEQLKEMFSQVGPVINFRMVYDRETGKPKGYGFIEYQDIETAQSAMRNLNSLEFNGRPLRVGPAQGEAKEELKMILGGPVVESPHGDPVPTEKAPEAISKAVASLPPEQMFELMKQMKMCIQNNPNEARTMLLQNPQLAYALLQAQIVMKIVDPQVAMAMLHRKEEEIPPIQPSPAQQPPPPQQQAPPPQQQTNMPQMNEGPPQGAIPPGLLQSPRGPAPNAGGPPNRGSNMMPGAPQMRMQGPGGPGMQGGDFEDFDEFQGRQGPGGPMQGGPMQGGHPRMQGGPPRMQGGHPRMQGGPYGGPPGMQGGPRFGPGPRGPGPRGGPPMGGRMGSMQGDPMGPGGAMGGPGIGGPGGPPGNMREHKMMGDPRAGPMGDPRGGRGPPGPEPGAAMEGASSGPGGPQISTQDQEKAALIMQVLQLSDAQIAMLPPDQRESILILKQQISGGQK